MFSKTHSGDFGVLVRFTWRSEEWREAYLLSRGQTAREPRRGHFNYILLGLLALGGGVDLAHEVLRSGPGRLEGTVLPMLLGLAAFAGLTFVVARFLRRRSRLRGLPALPSGEQRMTLQEAGWNVMVEGSAFDPVQPWAGVRGHCVGPTVIAMATEDGRTVGLPLRALTEEQGPWICRLLSRKVAHLAPA